MLSVGRPSARRDQTAPTNGGEGLVVPSLPFLRSPSCIQTPDLLPLPTGASRGHLTVFGILPVEDTASRVISRLAGVNWLPWPARMLPGTIPRLAVVAGSGPESAAAPSLGITRSSGSFGCGRRRSREGEDLDVELAAGGRGTANQRIRDRAAGELPHRSASTSQVSCGRHSRVFSWDELSTRKPARSASHHSPSNRIRASGCRRQMSSLVKNDGLIVRTRAMIVSRAWSSDRWRAGSPRRPALVPLQRSTPVRRRRCLSVDALGCPLVRDDAGQAGDRRQHRQQHARPRQSPGRSRRCVKTFRADPDNDERSALGVGIEEFAVPAARAGVARLRRIQQDQDVQ